MNSSWSRCYFRERPDLPLIVPSAVSVGQIVGEAVVVAGGVFTLPTSFLLAGVAAEVRM